MGDAGKKNKKRNEINAIILQLSRKSRGYSVFKSATLARPCFTGLQRLTWLIDQSSILGLADSKKPRCFAAPRLITIPQQ
jgi:hypothetical protein